MKTTLDLSEDLLQKAMTVSGCKTKTGVIVLALKELIRQSDITNLKEYKGKIDMEVDLDILRGRK